jgi:hypothetical protein
VSVGVLEPDVAADTEVSDGAVGGAVGDQALPEQLERRGVGHIEPEVIEVAALEHLGRSARVWTPMNLNRILR